VEAIENYAMEQLLMIQKLSLTSIFSTSRNDGINAKEFTLKGINFSSWQVQYLNFHSFILDTFYQAL
jgi:hypothetical protein